MAHQVETAFYTGIPAWHKVGTVVDEAPSIEDAIRLAGLDWTVLEEPVFYQKHCSDGDIPINIPNYKALVRSTDGKTLSIMKDSYTVLQNIDAFRFFDQILDSDLATLEAAGSLREGQRVWVLAKIRGAEADVVSNDTVEAYLLLCNSHDGSLAVHVLFTPIRVVCNNTLSFALSDAKAERVANLKIKHTASLAQSLEAVKQAIDVGHQTFRFTVEQYQYLTSKGCDIVGLKNYVQEVFDVQPNDEGVIELPRSYTFIEEAFEAGPGANLPGVSGTYWGAYNAITHWLDHTRGRNEDNRLNNSWFGASKSIRDRAFSVAINA